MAVVGQSGQRIFGRLLTSPAIAPEHLRTKRPIVIRGQAKPGPSETDQLMTPSGIRSKYCSWNQRRRGIRWSEIEERNETRSDSCNKASAPTSSSARGTPPAQWRDRYESKVGLFPVRSIHGDDSHEEGGSGCAACVAELKNRLSKYLRLARGGEEVSSETAFPSSETGSVSVEGTDDQELVLVAAGKLRLPKVRLNVKGLLKIPTGSVAGNKAIQAVLADRAQR